MTHSTLSDWLKRLQSQHPVEIDLGLERVSTVARAMNLVPAPIPTLTVAGTNGKGSVVAVLSSVLLASGLRVGSYTSPHLVSFNERICVNGSPVNDQGLVAAFNSIEVARGDISLTYFEVATLAALWIFREHEVDVQVLEVGLGGRLDAVNIIDADLTIITSIGLDHTDWLGDDRGLIAVEKAGVARPGRPCVVAEHDPPDALRRRLGDIGAEVSWISEDWILESPYVVTSSGSRYSLPESEGLLPQNVGAAVEALELSEVIALTQSLLDSTNRIGVPGRHSMHQCQNIDVLMDVAHNVESVRALVQRLHASPVTGKTRAIFGVMGDKPIHDMLAAAGSVVDEWNLVDLSHVDRAASLDDLASCIGVDNIADRGRFPTLWPSVRDRCSAEDRVVIFGSFFTVAEAMALFNADNPTEDARGIVD
ncbi:MAG: bifunctional folylpolyglutamate synthase/dihydrofolate synthase [Luminiphilus sp.]|nr:bifunctional folylpolyglutamate synthase/dihydrofolate synthase [Luminiphilus sp.]